MFFQILAKVSMDFVWISIDKSIKDTVLRIDNRIEDMAVRIDNSIEDMAVRIDNSIHQLSVRDVRTILTKLTSNYKDMSTEYHFCIKLNILLERTNVFFPYLH